MKLYWVIPLFPALGFIALLIHGGMIGDVGLMLGSILGSLVYFGVAVIALKAHLELEEEREEERREIARGLVLEVLNLKYTEHEGM